MLLYRYTNKKPKQQCIQETKTDDKKVIHCYFESKPAQRKYKKRVIKIWTESAKFNTNQRLADQARFTDFEILEVYGQVNPKEYAQRELPKQIEI